MVALFPVLRDIRWLLDPLSGLVMVHLLRGNVESVAYPKESIVVPDGGGTRL